MMKLLVLTPYFGSRDFMRKIRRRTITKKTQIRDKTVNTTQDQLEFKR